MTDSKRYLPEIDGLRAVAVIAVITNHFVEDWMQSGFLGVDIFFVISGFVITSYLREVRPAGWKEYLSEFYARRIKRLFPALVVYVLLTNIFFLTLTTTQSPELFRTGGLSLLGLSNIYLFLTSTDYFSLDARLNPFMHTWSLGVEEQFYLLFPAIFALAGFVPKLRKHNLNGTALLVGIAAASFLLYLAMYFISENAAFYLIPGRMWELSLGSLTFLLYERRQNISSWNTSSLISFIALIALLATSQIDQAAITITGGILTALVLWSVRTGDVVHKILTTKPLIFIGLLSYSLYLWHWGILVLGKWTIGDGAVAKALFLVLTLAFSMFSYYVIEKPLRYRSWSRSSLTTISYGMSTAAIIASLAIFVLPRLGTDSNNLVSQFFNIKQVDDWSEQIPCFEHWVGKYDDPFKQCLSAKRTGEKPHTAYLVGDSHAAQLVFMAEKGVQALPFTLRYMGPEALTDFPYVFFLKENAAPGKELTYILNNAQKGDYVIIAFHRGHLNNDAGHLNSKRDKHIPISQSIPINEATTNFINNSKTLFNELRAKGIKVILVNDAPLMRAVSTSPTCALQIQLFGESICRVSLAQDLHTRHRQDIAFQELKASFDNVFVWDPLPIIYGKHDSIDVIDEGGEYIMNDWNHITVYQSELLSEHFTKFFESTL